MRPLVCSVLIGLACAFHIGAQTVEPKPRPTPPDEGEVVKISTNLIQVDVSVTDRKGNPVKDLKAEDFEIYENGEKQKISNFSFISSVQERTEQPKPTDKNDTGVPAPPPAVRPEQVRRTIALVVDDLTLSFESAYHTRRALKKFVDELMQDGDLVAIIRTGAGIGALQQFTSDKRMLYAAIERVKWNPLGRGNIGAFAPIEPTLLEEAAASGDATVTEEDLEQERNFNNSFDDFRNSVFATGTLGALRYIVTGMGELPGRKSVILFSDGFRLLERDSQGFSDGGRVLEFLRQLVDQANRASVVFYTIDSRGLQTTGITAADRIVNSSPQALQETLSSRRDELLDTQDGLRYLADETGGFAVINNNDLAGGVRRVLEDQSYYLIGYDPDSDTFDPVKRRFNKLEIKVNRKDVDVRYRSGFFNVATENVAAAPAAKTPIQQITDALTSPFTINGISLSLNPLFGNDARTGSYVRSLLHVDGKDLTFKKDTDGSMKVEFAVLAASYGDNGVLVEQIGKNYTINMDERGYKKITTEGFVYHFTFPVKKPGAFQYRVAIRDTASGKVGSASQFIEVPNLKKGRPVVSGIVLQGFSTEQWQKLNQAAPDFTSDPLSSPMNDTSLRRFKLGSVLRYGFEVYNARLDASSKPNVSTKIRVFRDGKIVLDGNQMPLDISGQTEIKQLKSSGAISLGKNMPPGDYILQIIITDNLAKEKRRIATQFVQFEVVN
ncbi:MAG: VWA domain-containing protein [Blastocatellia bacterium]